MEPVQVERLPPFDQSRMTPTPAVEVTPAMAEAVIAEGQKDIFRDRPSDEMVWGSDAGIDVYSWLVKAGEVVSAWWSKRRDADLRRFWLGSDHLSSALYNVQARMTGIPIRVVPRDTTVQSQIALAAKFQDILMNRTESRSDRSRVGWEHGFGLFLLDSWTQDNGAFFAVEGPGRPDGPLTGAPTKLIHLDSWRCSRTGNEKYPVVFQDRDGKWYKLHRARVMAYSSLTSPIAGMHGIGFCAGSRSINNIQHLIDIGIYKQEKMGSRPARQMIIGQEGVTAEDIGKAFYVAESQMDDAGLSMYSKNVVIAPRNRSAASKISIDVRDLASAPDGYDENTSTTLAMYCVAMAFGVPARWLWPATSVGATKADALLQHTVGLTLGPAEILRSLTRLLETKFLPPTLQIIADFQDDEQDRAVAEIRKIRSEQRKNDLETQVISIRVAREQALAAGDLTESQFRQLEMEDGRQEDGSDVLTMFYSTDSDLRGMLNLNVEMPLAVDANDPIDMLLEIETAAMGVQERIAVARTAAQKLKAQQALAALTKLKSMYEKQAQAQVQSEMGDQIMEDATSGAVEEPAQPGQQGGPQGRAQGQPQEGEPQAQKGLRGVLGWLTKAFDFGVGTGGIIGGALARGGGGEFVNVADLQASMQRELARRMTSRRLSPEQRAANRAKVAEALGIDQSILDEVDSMQDKPPSKETQDWMVEKGLGRVDEKGNFSLTSAGIMFRNAMNSGNADRAKMAMSSGEQAKGKAPKGAGGKPDKEAQKRENREQVKGKVSDEIAPEDFDALVTFGEGGDIPEETAKRLAAKGLLEYDADGKLRTTRDYKAFMKAAEAGDSRAAKDALSRARERVAAVRDKIDGLRGSAESIAMDVQNALFELATVQGSQTIPDQLKAARLTVKIRRLIERMNKMTTQADQLERGVGGPLEPWEPDIPEPPSAPEEPEAPEPEGGGTVPGTGGGGTGAKGSAASGNWAHTSFNRMGVGRGGSDPSGAAGGGLATLGLDEESSITERREASQQIRSRRERGETDDEKGMKAEIREVKDYMASASEAERAGLQSYLSTLQASLETEQGMNDALWEYAGVRPEEATRYAWEQAADGLEKRSMDLYKNLTKPGIQLHVEEMRGAKDSGYMVVGSQQVLVKKGAFSVRAAAKMRGQMWAQAKETLGDHQGRLLRRAGFTNEEIRHANFFQRARLLKELGSMAMTKTKGGRTTRIDRVPVDARARSLLTILPDLAMTCLDSGNDPLSLPSLGGYKSMQWADTIRSVKLGMPELESAIAPLEF